VAEKLGTGSEMFTLADYPLWVLQTVSETRDTMYCRALE
jgi:hypothetical protein